MIIIFLCFPHTSMSMHLIILISLMSSPFIHAYEEGGDDVYHTHEDGFVCGNYLKGQGMEVVCPFSSTISPCA